jgi:hypothetical protein
MSATEVSEDEIMRNVLVNKWLRLKDSIDTKTSTIVDNLISKRALEFRYNEVLRSIPLRWERTEKLLTDLNSHGAEDLKLFFDLLQVEYKSLHKEIRECLCPSCYKFCV